MWLILKVLLTHTEGDINVLFIHIEGDIKCCLHIQRVILKVLLTHTEGDSKGVVYAYRG